MNIQSPSALRTATYESHYAKCKEAYPFQILNDAYSTTVVRDPINIDRNILESVASDVKDNFENNRDITENKFALYTNDFTNIKQLEPLCRYIVPQLESNFFGCYIKIERIHILQNTPDAPLESSWLWHYDNCPKEYLKFAVYLNDVDETCGPMEIVEGNGYIPVIPTYRISPTLQGQCLYPGSRIPQDIVQGLIENGGKITSLLGPTGTNFLFTPNVIHRGTAPTGPHHRRAIFFFLRPSLKRISNYVATAMPKKTPGDVKVYNLD